MQKREIEELAIYQIENETDIVPLLCLRELFLHKTSEIIYIIKNNVLYGIVSLGDIMRNTRNGEVKINKNYIALRENSILKAKKIFCERGNIHKIPLINKCGELVGDYSSWDDINYIERMQNRYINGNMIKKVLGEYKKIFVVEPVKQNSAAYAYLLKLFDRFQICYTVINKEKIIELMSFQVLYIFLNEDERRGMQCLYGLKLNQYDKLVDNDKDVQFSTFKSLLVSVLQSTELTDFNIRGFNIPYEMLDIKSSVLFSQLTNRGIKCFGLYSDEIVRTEYARKLMAKVRERVKRQPINKQEQWIHKGENDDFYGELYRLEEYADGSAQREINRGRNTFQYKKDIFGKYFNARNGRRVTCFQPDNYIGTIYFFGACTIVGGFVEDQFTIESFLQKRLLDQGYVYRVENYGAMLRIDSEVDVRLQEIENFSPNDIVIVLLGAEKRNVLPGMSLENIFEKNQVPSGWIMDDYHFYHCNNKANKVIADSVFDMIKPNLKKENNKKDVKIQIDFRDVMKIYIQKKYINQYFHEFQYKKYKKIGSIVMNCNPFTQGHRYLISKAREYVDFLIIFVVEEDLSLFSFEERFKLVVEGTKDLKNILIVPSGEFILSNNTFLEYFNKVDSNAVRVNAEYDINVFADYIAPALHINFRFVGEEPYDRITKIYNETMRKILPPKGVEFIEIPRMAIQDEIVSASKVRKYLENNEFVKACNLLPETTAKFVR